MPKVTAITVAYDRKVQPAPYESAGASVSLSLGFDETEGASVAAEIETAMSIAVAQVQKTLGVVPTKGAANAKIAAKTDLDVGGPLPVKTDFHPEKPAEKRVHAPEQKGKPTVEEKEKQIAEKAPAAPEKEQDKFPEPADMTKAITAAIERMQKKGMSDGSTKIKEKVRAYMPTDAAVVTYANIPPASRADFISDVDKLGR